MLRRFYANLLLLIIINLFNVGCSNQNSNNDNLHIPNTNLDSDENCVIEINDNKVIGVINKWHKDLYNNDFELMPFVVIANMLEPSLRNDIQKIGLKNVDESSLKILCRWARKNFTHTQSLKRFQNMPGKEPWGEIYFSQVYKKLLYSDMKAMGIYSNKITGECTSLSNLFLSVLRILGMEAENILNIRTDGHTFGLFKIEESLYIINNNDILPVNNDIKNWLKERTYYGFYNDRYYYSGEFTITDNFFKSNDSLLKKIENIILEKPGIYPYIEQLELENWDILFGETFKHNVFSALIGYTYQSLDVPNPSLYVRASTMTPKVIELSKELTTIPMILQWISENIILESIYLEEENRIMTGDQVVVYKKGGPRDRAVLFASILVLQGYDPTINMAKENAYVENSGLIYDMKQCQTVSLPEEDIIISIK